MAVWVYHYWNHGMNELSHRKLEDLIAYPSRRNLHFNKTVVFLCRYVYGIEYMYMQLREWKTTLPLNLNIDR